MIDGENPVRENFVRGCLIGLLLSMAIIGVSGYLFYLLGVGI